MGQECWDRDTRPRCYLSKKKNGFNHIYSGALALKGHHTASAFVCWKSIFMLEQQPLCVWFPRNMGRCWLSFRLALDWGYIPFVRQFRSWVFVDCEHQIMKCLQSSIKFCEEHKILKAQNNLNIETQIADILFQHSSQEKSVKFCPSFSKEYANPVEEICDATAVCESRSSFFFPNGQQSSN